MVESWRKQMTETPSNKYRLDEGVLIDSVQRNRDYPEHFWIPPLNDREGLLIGQFAKIGLEVADKGERFWVIITKVERSDKSLRYWGRVDNDLQVFAEDPNYEVSFGPHNILDTDI